MNNYRPISIIPVVANVSERIIYDQTFAYVTEHNSICSHQSGFRRLHSTVTALLEATDNWAFNIRGAPEPNLKVPAGTGTGWNILKFRPELTGRNRNSE